MISWFKYIQRPSKKYKCLLSIFFLLTIADVALSQNNTPLTQYDCDGRTNQNDNPCTGATAACTFLATEEKGCRCFDGVDNDGDGKIDAADPNCASYFGLEFIGLGSDCSITPPGASSSFTLVGNPIKSGQNTADTQSKVAAGDVDGNGVPDATITSKYNAELRLVATAASTGLAKFGGGSFSPGDIIADFKAKNYGGFAVCDGQSLGKFRYEHEVLIADIDGDGVAEIFSVISNRGNPPVSVPKSFYLLALKLNTYGPDGIQPMYAPVCLGVNRPGSFGIADMDGDGKAEIYMRDRIFAAETGKLLASPDYNADGVAELMTGTGTSKWDVSVTAASVAVDIKSAGSDGSKMELVCGSQIYTVPSLTTRSPATPSKLTLWKDMNSITYDITGDGVADQYFVKLMNDPDEYGQDTHSSCSVADIDKDGFVDVVVNGAVNSSGGRTGVFYWNIQDNTVTGMLTPTSAVLGIPAATSPDYNNYLNGWIWGTGRVNIGDANADGKLDLIFIAGNQLFCMSTNTANNQLYSLWSANAKSLPATGGNISVGYRTIFDTRSGVLTVTIYDFDNNGTTEIVYRDSQELAIVDGLTGTSKVFSAACYSHTYTEGPIIADVTGDGNTDICVACNRTDGGAFTITDPIQQQALGELRIWSSGGNWLPTRKVWNQPGYFVVNINDDLTLPFPQLDIASVFGNAPCPNGVPGPQTPYNVFLNQVPFLSANGCPVFPAPDLTFLGLDPDDPKLDPTDPSYDPNSLPTVFVESSVCGKLSLKVGLNITNSGDLPITTQIPVSFYEGSPYDKVTTGKLLYSSTINLNNLAVGDTLSVGDYTNAQGAVRPGDVPFIQFDGPGTTFELYVVLYNDGTTLPIDTAASNNGIECDITNNFWPITVVPKPFIVNIDSLDNVKCGPLSPDNGELISHMSLGPLPADTVTDLSPYTFQWYMADQVTPVGGADSLYNLTGLAAGQYYLVISDTIRDCASSPILGEVVDGGLVIPGLTVTLVSDQTACSPPNGSLKADVTGGNAGFNFSWEDAGGPIGVTGPLLTNVQAGSYTVIVTETLSGCQTQADGTIGDQTQEPDVTLSATDVVNCLNASSGSVTAAVVGSPLPDTTFYTFDWYFYDKATGTRGSILPAQHGNTGNPTRKYLPIGYYEVTVTLDSTGCRESNTLADTIEISDKTFLPEARLTQLAPQTSCDPLQPNGRLQADVYINNVLQNPIDYKFEWFEGQNTITPHTGGTSGVTGIGTEGQVAEKIKGGGQAYTVRVTTANQCSVTADTAVAEVLNNPIVTLNTTPNSVCDLTLGFVGSVNLTSLTFGGGPITLPDPNYALTWYDGSIVDPTKIRAADANKSSLTQLDSGFYTLVVENTLLHCKSVANIKQVLSTKKLPVISTSVTASTNCIAGKENGLAQVTNVDGAGTGAPYTFEWYNGNTVAGAIKSNSPVYGSVTPGSGLQGGAGAFFTVLVKNTLDGCTNTAVVNVPDAKIIPVITLAAQDNSICDPSLTVPAATFNGKVTATVTNQVGLLTDYSFVFGGGNTVPPTAVQTANVFDKLNGGPTAYTATTTHTPTGCVSSQVSIPVSNVQDLPDLTTSSIASTNCVVGKEDGQASVLTVDGTAVGVATGYTYAWTGPVAPAFPITNGTNNANTAHIIKVQGGAGYDYTVLVTNQSNGCQTTLPVGVADAKIIPVITLAAQDNSICDPSLTVPAATFNGKVTATVTNQVGLLTDYSFVFGGGNTVPPTAVQTANVFDKLNGGPTAYTATTTHTPTGCVSSQVSIPVSNVQDLPDLTTSSIASTNCVVGKEDGQASVLTVDGTAVGVATGYTYAWTGPVAPAFPITNGTNNANTAHIIKVQGGAGYDYTVLVTNQLNGCQTTLPVGVADAKIIPVITLAAQDNSICDPSLTVPAATFNGKVTATVTNQVGLLTDYSFVFGGGNTVPPTAVQTANVFDKLNGGPTAYTATTTHTPTGCVSSQVSIPVSNVQDLPDLTTSSIASTNCVVGKEDGQASVLTVDGTAVGVATGYTYAWTGPVAPAFPITNGTNNANTAHIIKVQGGAGYDYTVLVTNQSNGCQTTLPVGVADAKIIPVITLAAQDNSICDPSLTVPAATFNGKVTATVTNQVGLLTDYSFVFGGGNTVPPTAVQTANVFDKLNGGPTAYTATTTHTPTGCVSSQVSIPVSNVQDLPDLTTSSIASTNCVVGKEDGQASVLTVDGTAVGVATGYTYAWTGPVAPAFPITNGTNNANTAHIIKVQGGAGYDYTVLVTNQLNGCYRLTLPVGVADAKIIPVITLAAQDNSICDPSLTVPAATFNGKVTATVTNQVGLLTDYSFVFGGGNTVPPTAVQTANVFDKLNGGPTAYTATTTHTPTGCVSSQVSIPVSNVQDLPDLTTSSIASTNCVVGKEDGQASVLTVDGTAVGVATGYTYAWTGPVAPAFPITNGTNNANTAHIIKVQGGAGYDYTVLVTNQSNGCQTTLPVNVADVKALPTLVLTPQPNTICDPAKATSGAFDGQVLASEMRLVIMLEVWLQTFLLPGIQD